jgi:hypothetical protein
VRDWAVPPDFRISGGAGRTYPSFTVRASTGRTAGTGPRGVLTDGRLERLLALIDRWLGEVQAHLG